MKSFLSPVSQKAGLDFSAEILAELDGSILDYGQQNHLSIRASSPTSIENIVPTGVPEIHYTSLQDEPSLRKQMPDVLGPVFSITLQNEKFAKKLPSKLSMLFQHKISLGGVESLIKEQLATRVRVACRGAARWTNIWLDNNSQFRPGIPCIWVKARVMILNS
ncbi:hypothetical protein P175DRAFT_0530203 [Aspergillus ochraceoroseus IBT 24754]|uniref:Uncharacterized protein n=1 Tax=Aspergillus ochraceoroseus IBT 24754 TaxID=1392256 RepID=A0A2T5M3J9_9EURO|nr:uncharacterized protein P175DRAFT_0530203 [Aspergillus ochraceoroseus IBT 24754]PTU23107.1 hypothetical protein P175DRAFT_0530203 [Aspergillus ochraceoroseus IBT 24754]